MSQTYMNVDLDYFDHPQTVRLIGLLGRGAEVLPLKLWRTCGKFFSEKGRLTGYSAEAVEHAVGWWGERGRAIKALMSEGVDYLGQDAEGTYYAKHWEQHQGHIFALREKSRKANDARWKKLRDGREAVHMDSSGISSGSPPGTPPSFLPSKKKGARGAGNDGTDPNCGPRINPPRYCKRCKTAQVFDSSDFCLGDCSLCSMCQEPKGDIQLDPKQKLYLCGGCRKLSGKAGEEVTA